MARDETYLLDFADLLRCMVEYGAGLSSVGWHLVFLTDLEPKPTLVRMEMQKFSTRVADFRGDHVLVYKNLDRGVTLAHVIARRVGGDVSIVLLDGHDHSSTAVWSKVFFVIADESGVRPALLEDPQVSRALDGLAAFFALGRG